MSVVNLYNGIYTVLANDPDVLNYLGIGTSADNLTKAKHIQKRAKPTNLTDNMPLITFYAPPGRREGANLEVYDTQMVFDCYTYDNVPLAQNVGQRIIDLFDGEIHPMYGVETFESMFVTGHESESDLANTYCFTVVINFSISVEKS